MCNASTHRHVVLFRMRKPSALVVPSVILQLEMHFLIC